MRQIRPWREVLQDWAADLSEKLERPADLILSKGLSAHDFSPSSFVEIRDPHGMITRLPFAFAVVRPSEAQAAVFTEHSGYLEFDLEDGCVVAEIKEHIYRHESDGL
ncbi:hypothetical protein ACFPOA_15835 [Lysobacter niabensis]|uniref:hypothetical protein n=1 Tax=Agrilutibacter niabensis TaxID=380628 RepID=UPI003614DC53